MAWQDETIQRQAVTVVYSYTNQASSDVATVVAAIRDLAQQGIDRLTEIRDEAAACIRTNPPPANPHTNGSQHGAANSAKRTQAVQSIERAWLRIQEGLILSRLSDAGALLGCKQELEHPGGGNP